MLSGLNGVSPWESAAGHSLPHRTRRCPSLLRLTGRPSDRGMKGSIEPLPAQAEREFFFPHILKPYSFQRKQKGLEKKVNNKQPEVWETTSLMVGTLHKPPQTQSNGNVVPILMA